MPLRRPAPHLVAVVEEVHRLLFGRAAPEPPRVELYPYTEGRSTVREEAGGRLRFTLNAHFDGAPEEAPRDAVPWYELDPPALATHVAVFGHWAAHGARQGPRWIATDSACVWGGSLTAVRLPDRHVFSVPALEPPAA